jgi:PleD family two-component response regulator
MEQARTRVILIGGDARRLRSLRVFLDSLNVFDPVAVATGGAGLNALARQPWSAAIVVDDLNDMLPEQLIQAARQGGIDTPVVALVVTADRHRVHALYAAGVTEVVGLGAAPSPEIARALVRTLERQSLVDRLAALEAKVSQHQIADAETGLYPPWRFDEDWRLEQARAGRRGGELALLLVGLETSPTFSALPERERITLLRQVGRIIRTSLREGDLAVHDGGGRFRVLMTDVDSAEAAEVAARLSIALRQGLAASGVPAAAAVHLGDPYEAAAPARA